MYHCAGGTQILTFSLKNHNHMLQQTPRGPFFTPLSYKLLAQEQRVENDMKMSGIR